MDKKVSAPPNKPRFVIVVVMLLMLAFVIIAKYAVLMLQPQDAVQPPLPRITADRGNILDRNGRILAMQTRLGNISVWRPQVGNISALAAVLGPALDMGEAEVADRIALSATDFIYIKKQVDRDTLLQIEELQAAGSLPGVGIEPVRGRIYPEGSLAGQIIGFTGDENIGLSGIEYAFDGELQAKEADGPGGIAGNQVVLTIDTSVQYMLEDIAQKALAENQAESVMLMAMDPRTGEILGAATAPAFDPNFFRDSTAEMRMVRPAVWAYEPGSVFKVFSMAAMMDSGDVLPSSTYICNGTYTHVTNRGERIVINCLAAHGPVDPRRIIINSCNAGIAYASDALGRTAFSDSIRKLGFGERTGLGLSGETTGILSNPDRWSDRTKPTIAMGQEIAVSALQMLQAATAIANDGIMVTPRLILQIEDANGANIRRPEAPDPRRVLKPETARELRSYMVDVTSNVGTGWRANVGDLPIAVKTGTAQIQDRETGTYSDTDYIASCMAILPSDNPSMVLYTVIVRPKGPSNLGGRIAAPVIREAADAVIDYMGILRGRNPAVPHSGAIVLPEAPAAPFISDIMPDLRGYSKRQLLPLLLRDDLVISMNGEGYVARQTPLPGSKLAPDTHIYLELE